MIGACVQYTCAVNVDEGEGGLKVGFREEITSRTGMR